MCIYSLFQFNMSSAQIERNKTKEQLEEEKKISLSFRIKPLDIESLSVEKLRQKANELWECIVKLETEKYDLEERQKRQDYDVSIRTIYHSTYYQFKTNDVSINQLKELKERQKQQLRHKALKKGLDPEALTGKYPVSSFNNNVGINNKRYCIFNEFHVLFISAQNPSRLQI